MDLKAVPAKYGDIFYKYSVIVTAAKIYHCCTHLHIK